MIRRRKGTGTIEETRDGAFRARLPDADRTDLGIFASHEEASRMLDAALVELTESKVFPNIGFTLRTFAVEFFADREAADFRGVKKDKNKWNTHVASAAFIDWPLAAIGTVDVEAWVQTMLRKKTAPKYPGERRPKKLGATTVQAPLNLLRTCFGSAVTKKLIDRNPCDGVKIPKPRKVEDTEDPWTYLEPAEQLAFLSCERIPREVRDITEVAMGSGVREGELMNVELKDVHADGEDPYMLVRYGSRPRAGSRARKNGKKLEVPLFGHALDAVRRWLKYLPSFAPSNPHKLLFPTASGARRPEGKPPGGSYKKDGHTRYRWHDYVAMAGIERRVRFHDMRHTCAASLVSGWWGRRWSLEEVKELLGHSDIEITQRYAHLAKSALKAAARGTAGRQDKPATSPQDDVTVQNHSGLQRIPKPLVARSIRAGGASGRR
jgi:integrase